MTTATEAKHTPGPFHANAILSGRIVGDETAERFDKIQICGRNCTVATVYRRGDASLLKAAPELLEALRALVDSPNAKQNDMWDSARAAIAKAEGRETLGRMTGDTRHEPSTPTMLSDHPGGLL